MPSSVHKILIHGADIIQYFGMLPIGKLSEEASESRNKDFRTYREHHSRKVSRIASNEDILNNLLLSSDPKLALVRPRLPKCKNMTLSVKSQELLVLPAQETFNTEFIDVNCLEESDSE